MEERLIDLFNDTLEKIFGPLRDRVDHYRFIVVGPLNKIPHEGISMLLYETDIPEEEERVVHQKYTFSSIRSPIKLSVDTHSTSGELRPSPVVKIISKEKRNRYITKDNRFLLWIYIYGRAELNPDEVTPPNSEEGGKTESKNEFSDKLNIHMLACGTWYNTPLSGDGKDKNYPYILFECEVPKPVQIERSDTMKWKATFTLVKKRPTTVEGRSDYHPTEYVPVMLNKRDGKMIDFSVRDEIMWRKSTEIPFPAVDAGWERTKELYKRRIGHKDKKKSSEEVSLLSFDKRE